MAGGKQGKTKAPGSSKERGSGPAGPQQAEPGLRPSAGGSQLSQQRSLRSPGGGGSGNRDGQRLERSIQSSIKEQQATSTKIRSEGKAAQLGIDALQPKMIGAAWQDTKGLIAQHDKSRADYDAAIGDASGLGEAEVGEDFESFRKRLARLDVAGTKQELLRDSAIFVVALTLSAQTFQGKALKGSTTIGVLGGDPREALDRVGKNTVELAMDARRMIRAIDQVEALDGSFGAQIKVGKLGGQILAVIERHSAHGKLLLIEVVNKSKVPRWLKEMAGKQRIDALVEASAEDKLIPPARMKIIEKTAGEITEELDSWLYASDDKLNKLVARHKGAEREYLLQVLSSRGQYLKLFYRGDRFALDDLKKDAGQFKDDDVLNAKVIDKSTGRSEGLLDRQENLAGGSLASTAGAAGEIAGDMARGLVSAPFHLLGEFYAGLSDVPIIGEFFAVAGHNFKDLGRELDDATDYTARMGHDALSYRDVVARVGGNLEAGLFKLAVARGGFDPSTGQDLAEQFEAFKDSYKTVGDFISIGGKLSSALVAGKDGIPKDPAGKEALKAKWVGASNATVDAFVEHYTGKLPAFDVVDKQNKQIKRAKKKMLQAKILEDGQVHGSFMRIESLQRRMLKSQDEGALKSLDNEVRKEGEKLRKRTIAVRAQAEAEIDQFLAETSAVMQKVSKLKQPRAVAALVLGFAVKKGMGVVIGKVIGARGKVNVGAIVQAIPKALYTALTKALVSMITEVVRDLKGGVWAEFAKAGADLTLSFGAKAYDNEINLYLQDLTREVFKPVAHWANEMIASAQRDLDVHLLSTDQTANKADAIASGAIAKTLAGKATKGITPSAKAVN